MTKITRLRMAGLLSFPGEMQTISLGKLNVLIGRNAAGKSNVIETLGLLRALLGDLGSAIAAGGGIDEWLCKNEREEGEARIEVEVDDEEQPGRKLHYGIAFRDTGRGAGITTESIHEKDEQTGTANVVYEFAQGRPAIRIRAHKNGDTEVIERAAPSHNATMKDSVLATRREPELYPELRRLQTAFGSIRMMRNGPSTPHPARRAQRTSLRTDRLSEDQSNLALVLNRIEHETDDGIEKWIRRLAPRIERVTTPVSGDTISLQIHEHGLREPIGGERISNGTMQLLALLATLYGGPAEETLCLEHPEGTLHPDVAGVCGDLMAEAARRKQLIVTTHSQALVSTLMTKGDTFTVCERADNGTRLRRIDPEILRTMLEHNGVEGL